MRPKKTVLCVSPCEVRLSRQAFVLQTRGYRVLRATSGEDAMKMVAENRFGPGGIDVVVTEYELEDFSGNRLAVDAKTMCPGLPVLVISHMMVTIDNASSADRFLPRSHCAGATLLECIRILAARKRGPKKLTTPVWHPETQMQESVVA